MTVSEALAVMPVMVWPLGGPAAGHDRPDDDAVARSGLRVEPVRDGGRLRELVRTGGQARPQP
ncbi:hypothetical protein ACGFY8_02650 [Streptomyces sp. NPDC048232]|uniref:hypothetical protein n=1 Tax=Streptomyces sp. NPDC048232 TaxID=3365520 RepID=UPI0037172CE9